MFFLFQVKYTNMVEECVGKTTLKTILSHEDYKKYLYATTMKHLIRYQESEDILDISFAVDNITELLAELELDLHDGVHKSEKREECKGCRTVTFDPVSLPEQSHLSRTSSNGVTYSDSRIG